MSISRAGLKQIVTCDAGTLAGTPGNPIAIGLRSAATMEIAGHKEVEDYRGRKLRNMKNFKIEAESLQPTMKMLERMKYWTNLNCDLQVITRPQINGASDVYQFVGDNKLGLDFEYMVSGDKRSLKATYEGAMEYERAQELIDGVASVDPIVFADISGEGQDFTKYRVPFYLSFKAPQSEDLISELSKGEIKERSYSIKTKNQKTVYNASIVDWLTFEFSIEVLNASVASQIEVMSKSMIPSILIKERNSGEYYDAFDFNAGTLALTEVYSDSDENRSLKMTFAGDVHISDITFAYGDGNGGATGDTDGETGGTMKIGY